ncbi:amino acid ABC transporter permease [Indioceanicola profundi]|uniref:amino acid ABC transporter permease n=1 Tax=Indioceanicola profundi TaxID=2220096 RepID=UPI000E6AAE3D|nr:amino acid ABC transporter permease [Indioceanicola profundi]
MAQATEARSPVRTGPPKRGISLNDPMVRSVLWQILTAGLVGLIAWYLISNTMENLARQSISSGYDFLDRPAGFQIGEQLVAYGPADSYARAFLVGLLNTLKVAAIGIVLATILGTLVGIARLSTNWLVAKLSAGFVEMIRNVPLLLQLFLWYGLLTEGLPGPRQAMEPVPGVFLSNRGLKIPGPAEDPAWFWIMAAFGVGVLATILLSRWNRARQQRTGQVLPMGWIGTGLVVGLPLLVLIAFGGAALDMPALQGFNFTGGLTLTPEFAALLFGLVVYTSAFIAEIVRSGILAVSHGQTEAARALGLSEGKVLRLVVLPQALRVIIPPTTSQYLNLTKNSSLAVAIGYPDFVSVANTTINQTGQAIEGVASIMAVFLTISLALSFLMNWYNTRIALKER